MDVGDPSNMERLRALYGQAGELRAAVRAYSVTDTEIRARIRTSYRRYGQIFCPHTATAAEAWERLPEGLRHGRRWVLVSTAHPAKFREIVEPLIGRTVEVPETLEKLFARPVQCVEIEGRLEALGAVLQRED
jgi:threonine synthase